MTTRDAAVLAGVATRLPSVDLPTVLAAAELSTRTDTKYLVPIEVFPALIADLYAKAPPNGAGRLSVLEIDGRRLFGYESVYFDTPELACYHAHRQGRRHRYKVRTRTYVDSGGCMLEVKGKDGRGRTDKERIAHDPARARELGAAREFVRSATDGWHRVDDLAPVLVNRYRRLTLVDLANTRRITCDVDVRATAITGTQRHAEFGAGHVLMEVKAARGDTSVARQCHRYGVRAVSVSKYAVGCALLAPQLPANRWARLLRRHGAPAWRRSVGTSV